MKSPFMIDLTAMRGAAAMYGAASIAALPAVLWARARWGAAALGLAAAGVLLQIVAIAAGAHGWAMGGLQQVQSILALLVAGAFLLIAWRYRTASFGLFALPLACLLVLPAALGGDRYVFSSPLVRGGWVAVHVASLLIADVALVFSLLASLLYFVQERRLKQKNQPGFFAWLPPLEVMDRIAQTNLVLGFAAMTVGLAAGSLIAQERVGAAYFEDPKVVLSFAMWMVYVIILLFRQTRGLRGRQAVYVSSAAFLVVLSVWAANLLSSVHRFAAP